MDDEAKLGIQNWGGYYQAPPLLGNLGLQLRSSVGERDTKPFFSSVEPGGGYLPRECRIAEPSTMPIDFVRDFWYHNNRDSSKFLHVFQGNHHQHCHNYEALPPEAAAHSFEMLQQVEVPREEKVPLLEGPVIPQLDAEPLKKRSKGQGRSSKTLKPKTTKKAKTTKGESVNPSGRGRSVKRSIDMVINGIDLDLSGIPTPVCTCTGHPQQCYRWGAGGWQSACCTTSISLYPLPMSTKRRGARIAGRKMSQGAFKKVLEMLAGEGVDFSSPIDLKSFWAKHGTNKFVTIR